MYDWRCLGVDLKCLGVDQECLGIDQKCLDIDQECSGHTNSIPPPTMSLVHKTNGAQHIKTSSFHCHAGYQSKLFVVA